MKALIADAQALPKLDAARVTSRSRHVHAGTRHRLQPRAARDLPASTLEGYFRMWHHHFEFLLLGYGAYMTFFDFCKKAFPEISDQTISAHGRRHGGRDLPPRRRAEAPRALRRRARRRRTTSSMARQCRAGARHRSTGVGAPGTKWLEELETVARPVVQRQRRRRLLPLPPQLERRPDHAVRRRCPDYIEQMQGRREPRAADGAAAGRAQAARSRTTASCSTPDEERAAYDQMIDARAPRVPLRRGPQVLLRALVHQPVLQQDPRVRRAAGRARLLRRRKTTCST